MLGTMAGMWISALLGIFCVFVLIGAAVGNSAKESTVKVDKHSILFFNLAGEVAERNQPKSLVQFIQEEQSSAPTLQDMIAALRLAKDDKKIEGLYLQCDGAAMGSASREELLQAIADFKESGKWIFAYADNYEQGDYVVATTADHLVLNPQGAVNVHGVGGTTPFYKGLLDKLGVKVQIFKVGTFKSAVEPFILDKMSEPARLQMQQYCDSLWLAAASTIAENRQLSLDRVNTLSSELIYTRPAETFVEDKLVDRLEYRRVAVNSLKELSGIDSEDALRLVSPSEYLASKKSAFNFSTNDKHIAVLFAVGDIVDSGKEGIVGPDVVDQIVELADNDKVLGMVLRVNSPGGSAFASEQIWEALDYFKSKNKQLYVSMGDYAASGGYYISCGADKIFADRTTITGSIGVFGMIPDLSGLVTDKFGISFSTVQTNPNAAPATVLEPLSEPQKAAIQQSVENIYDLFTKRVAEGRHMAQDSVKAIAEGRVWVGSKAIQIGLVDQIGSLQDAVNAMLQNYDIDEKAVVAYPEIKEKFWEQILRESGSFDDLKVPAYDAKTLRELEVINRLRNANPIQARMEYIYFQ